MGDVNTTLIRTVKGRTIVLQYDVTTPRPYSRHQTVCGTKGFMQKYPVPCILLDEYGKEPLAGEDFEKVMERYKHPFTATIGEEAKRKEMPNEMNYIMDYRLVYCLRNGLPFAFYGKRVKNPFYLFDFPRILFGIIFSHPYGYTMYHVIILL